MADFENELKQFPDHAVLAVAENESAPRKSRLSALKELIHRGCHKLVHTSLSDLYEQASAEVQSAAASAAAAVGSAKEKTVATAQTVHDKATEELAKAKAHVEQVPDHVKALAQKAADQARAAAVAAQTVLDKQIAQAVERGEAAMDEERQEAQEASAPSASVTTKTLNEPPVE